MGLAITLRMSAVAVCRSSASLCLVEQPRVFDRNRCLVGERPQQLNVMIGKHARLAARARDEPMNGLAHQR